MDGVARGLDGPFGQECFCLGSEWKKKPNNIKRLEIVTENQSVLQACLVRKQNLTLACLDICAEVVELEVVAIPLYIHSATAHLRATLFKKKKKLSSYESQTLRRWLLREPCQDVCGG